MPPGIPGLDYGSEDDFLADDERRRQYRTQTAQREYSAAVQQATDDALADVTAQAERERVERQWRAAYDQQIAQATAQAAQQAQQRSLMDSARSTWDRLTQPIIQGAGQAAQSAGSALTATAQGAQTALGNVGQAAGDAAAGLGAAVSSIPDALGDANAGAVDALNSAADTFQENATTPGTGEEYLTAPVRPIGEGLQTAAREVGQGFSEVGSGIRRVQSGDVAGGLGQAGAGVLGAASGFGAPGEVLEAQERERQRMVQEAAPGAPAVNPELVGAMGNFVSPLGGSDTINRLRSFGPVRQALTSGAGVVGAAVSAGVAAKQAQEAGMDPAAAAQHVAASAIEGADTGLGLAELGGDVVNGVRGLAGRFRRPGTAIAEAGTPAVPQGPPGSGAPGEDVLNAAGNVADVARGQAPDLAARLDAMRAERGDGNTASEVVDAMQAALEASGRTPEQAGAIVDRILRARGVDVDAVRSAAPRPEQSDLFGGAPAAAAPPDVATRARGAVDRLIQYVTSPQGAQRDLSAFGQAAGDAARGNAPELVGGVAGGVAGSQQEADDPWQRFANTLGGAVLGAGAGRAARNLTRIARGLDDSDLLGAAAGRARRPTQGPPEADLSSPTTQEAAIARGRLVPDDGARHRPAEVMASARLYAGSAEDGRPLWSNGHIMEVAPEPPGDLRRAGLGGRRPTTPIETNDQMGRILAGAEAGAGRPLTAAGEYRFTFAGTGTEATTGALLDAGAGQEPVLLGASNYRYFATKYPGATFHGAQDTPERKPVVVRDAQGATVGVVMPMIPPDQGKSRVWGAMREAVNAQRAGAAAPVPASTGAAPEPRQVGTARGVAGTDLPIPVYGGEDVAAGRVPPQRQPSGPEAPPERVFPPNRRELRQPPWTSYPPERIEAARAWIATLRNPERRAYAEWELGANTGQRPGDQPSVPMAVQHQIGDRLRELLGPEPGRAAPYQPGEAAEHSQREEQYRNDLETARSLEELDDRWQRLIAPSEPGKRIPFTPDYDELSPARQRALREDYEELRRQMAADQAAQAAPDAAAGPAPAAAPSPSRPPAAPQEASPSAPTPERPAADTAAPAPARPVNTEEFLNSPDAEGRATRRRWGVSSSNVDQLTVYEPLNGLVVNADRMPQGRAFRLTVRRRTGDTWEELEKRTVPAERYGSGLREAVRDAAITAEGRYVYGRAEPATTRQEGQAPTARAEAPAAPAPTLPDDLAEGHTLDVMRNATTGAPLYTVRNAKGEPMVGGPPFDTPDEAIAGARERIASDRTTAENRATRATEQEQRIPRLVDAYERTLRLGGREAAALDRPQDVRRIAKEANPAFDPQSERDVDEAYDALEGALNRRWRVHRTAAVGADLAHPTETQTAELLQIANQVEGRLPNRTRSTQITELQQFSTPATIAEAAAIAARVGPGDTVLEPTAGTGNLITPLLGRGARIVANELDARRVAVLNALTGQDAGVEVRQGDALRLALDGVKADVVITNPPWGKYSTRRYGKPVGLAFTPADVAERFLALTMETLPRGGRMVAVMPTTMLESNGFLRWLRANHTTRAVIQSPPGAYNRRGTNVESVLLVVDKGTDLPEAGAPVMATTAQAPGTWDDYARLVAMVPERATLEGRATDADASAQAPGAPPPAGLGPRRAAGGPDAGRSGAAAGRPAGGQAAQDAPVRRPGRPGEPRPGRRPRVVAADPSVDGRAAEHVEPAPVVPGRPAGSAPAPAGGRAAGPVPVAGPAAPRPAGAPDAVRQRLLAERAEQEAAVRRSPRFALYEVRHGERVAPHPRVIVETQAISGVPYPALEYQPHGDVRAALERGVISDEQFDVVAATGQAMERGHAIMVADDVGVGKSREIAGVALDLLKRGVAKRVLISTKGDQNVLDLMDEIRTVAGDRLGDVKLIRVKDYPKTKKVGLGTPDSLPEQDNAIYLVDAPNFAPYEPALADLGLSAWLADEAHVYKNLDAGVGRAWQDLHAKLMNRRARLSYFSATPAQTPEDLEYLYGLREWTPDAQGFSDFLLRVTGRATTKEAEAIAARAEGYGQAKAAEDATAEAVGGDSSETAKTEGKARGFGRRSGGDAFTLSMSLPEMEQVTRELRRKGKYIARDLWRGGVEFDVREAALTPPQAEGMDRAIAFMRDVEAAFNKYGKANELKGAGTFGVRGHFQNEVKRRLFDYRLDTVIQDAREALARGEQVVIFTNSVAKPDDEGGFLAAAIRVINTQRVEKLDEGEYSDPEDIPEALMDVARLKEGLRELPALRDPVEVMEAAFGKDTVAFIIGATSLKQRPVVMKEFQEGKRRVAVISSAGTTGISLHHNVEGTGRRFLMLADSQWRADEFKQVMGRVDRSGQLSSPRIAFYHLGQASERKFIATIASRMNSLGALSKGEAGTAGANDLETFEVEGRHGKLALDATWDAMPQDLKEWFTGKGFREALYTPRGEEARTQPRVALTEAATIKGFLLELQTIPLAQARQIDALFAQKYEEVATGAGPSALARAARARGTITESTPIGDDLVLHHVEAPNGKGGTSTYGVLEGVIMLPPAGMPPRIPEIMRALQSPASYELPRRQYLTFTDRETGRRASGLVIPPTRVPAVAKALGADVGGARMSPENVLEYLKDGERIELQGPAGIGIEIRFSPYPTPTVRIEKKSGTGARPGASLMDHRAILMQNGAKFSPTGGYFFVPEGDLPRFMERFPLAGTPQGARAPAAPQAPAPPAPPAPQETPARGPAPAPAPETTPEAPPEPAPEPPAAPAPEPTTLPESVTPGPPAPVESAARAAPEVTAPAPEPEAPPTPRAEPAPEAAPVPEPPAEPAPELVQTPPETPAAPEAPPEPAARPSRLVQKRQQQIAAAQTQAALDALQRRIDGGLGAGTLTEAEHEQLADAIGERLNALNGPRVVEEAPTPAPAPAPPATPALAPPEAEIAPPAVAPETPPAAAPAPVPPEAPPTPPEPAPIVPAGGAPPSAPPPAATGAPPVAPEPPEPPDPALPNDSRRDPRDVADDVDRTLHDAMGAEPARTIHNDLERAISSLPARLYRDWVDRLDPGKRVVDYVYRLLGRAPTELENIYLLARLYAGRGSRAAQAIRDYVVPGFRGLQPEDVGYLNTYLAMMDAWDKAKAVGVRRVRQGVKQGEAFADALDEGLDAAERRLFSGATHANRPEDIAAEFRRRLGDARAARVFTAAEGVWGLMRHLRRRLREASGISEDVFNAWEANHPHYTRIEISRYVDEEAAGRIGIGRPAFTIGDLHIRHLSERGTARKRISPLESAMRDAFAVEGYAERNEVFRALLAARENSPELRDVMRRLSGDAKIDATTEVRVTGFADGKKVEYAVLKEFEPVFRGGTAKADATLEVARGIGTALGVPLLRAGAVAWNALYAVIEPIRSTWSFLARQGGRNLVTGRSPRALARAYLDLAIHTLPGDRQSEAFARLLRAGGGDTDELMGLDPDRIIRRLTREGFLGGRVRVVQNAGDLVGALGDTLRLAGSPVTGFRQVVQEAPRLAAFRMAERAGASQRRAAFAAREINLDTGRSGVWGRVANQVVPFFNIAVQGTDKVAREFRANPAKAAAMVAASFVVPAVLVELWNRSDPDRDEAYRNVPSYLRDTGLVVMLPVEWWGGQVGPNRDGSAGQRPYIWLPLPQEYNFLKIVTDEALRRQVGDSREAADLLLSLVGSASPIRPAEGAAGLLPPVGEVALGLQQNRDFFRDRPIVPEALRNLPVERQVTPATSAFGRAFGRATGRSPIQVDYAVNTLGGGLGRQFLSASDALAAAAGVPETERGTTESRYTPAPGADAPVVGGLFGRVLRTQGGRVQETAIRDAERRVQAATRNAIAYLEADPVYQALPPPMQAREQQLLSEQVRQEILDTTGAYQRPKETGLPFHKYILSKSPAEDLATERAKAAFDRWVADPRNVPKPDKETMRLAMRAVPDPRYKQFQTQSLERRRAVVSRATAGAGAR